VTLPDKPVVGGGGIGPGGGGMGPGGGTMVVTSKPGQGTKILIKFPYTG